MNAQYVYSGKAAMCGKIIATAIEARVKPNRDLLMVNGPMWVPWLFIWYSSSMPIYSDELCWIFYYTGGPLYYKLIAPIWGKGQQVSSSYYDSEGWIVYWHFNHKMLIVVYLFENENRPSHYSNMLNCPVTQDAICIGIIPCQMWGYISKCRLAQWSCTLFRDALREGTAMLYLCMTYYKADTHEWSRAGPWRHIYNALQRPTVWQ